MNRKHLAGSKWTRVDAGIVAASEPTSEPAAREPSGGDAPYYCHWRVVEVRSDSVVMQAILQPDVFVTVAIALLKGCERWRAGWH